MAKISGRCGAVYRSLSKPFVPSLVCLGPRMAPRVPFGNEPPLVGIIVTSVRPFFCFFFKHRPCVLLPCSVQPFLNRISISSRPDSEGSFLLTPGRRFVARFERLKDLDQRENQCAYERADDYEA